MAAIVQLDRVTKVFDGSTLAVDDVSLDVEEGEFVTLLGPSGCGKTTILRMIGGFEGPSKGAIRLAGEDVTHLPPYRRQVNMVFQDYALFPHMTVAKNVAYGLERAKLPKAEIQERVRAALVQVDLTDKGERRPHQLSGGQRQRVALARAIVRQPKVLLLDEPLSALDANLREQMQVELKHLHDRLGLTFIMVTHDQTEALVMSDRVVVMERGRVAQQGTPADIYDRPASPYVANFIGTSNLLPARVADASDEAFEVVYGTERHRLRRNGVAARPGDEVLLGIRPEKAAIVGARGDVPERFSILAGVVKEVLFHGNSVRIRLTLAAGDEFQIDHPLGLAAARANLPRIGSDVLVAVDPENVALFRKGGRP
jgi:putative spermidine/putrescine transport system ATP-binding protein/spermidine/putrescine transport system ATP-binding protein